MNYTDIKESALTKRTDKQLEQSQVIKDRNKRYLEQKQSFELRRSNKGILKFILSN